MAGTHRLSSLLKTCAAVTATILALGLGTAPALAGFISVSASVSGDIGDIVTFTQDVDPATGQIIDSGGTPIPLSALPYLTYGDFVVSGGNDLSATTTTVGDGINDETWWVFDFTGDPDIGAFMASSDPLVSGVLTLSLVPRQTPPLSEGTYVPGLNGAYEVPISGSQDVATNVVIQLVRPDLVPSGHAHNASDILSRFMDTGTDGPSNALSFGAGQLPFKFFDDAQVLAASLELTRGVQDVPEPGTLGLIALGLLALGVSVRRRA